MKRRCRGTALITAMLVVAIAVGAVVGMTSRQQIDVQRTSNLLHSDQAYQYALGVESWAAGVLAEDAGKGASDGFTDPWAQPLPPRDITGGQVAGYVVDAQGRFNVNTLLVDGEVNSLNVTRFQRLLRILDLDEHLTYSVIDWLDSDIEGRLPHGAEDEFYLRQTPDYRSANRKMAEASEIRLVRGVDADVYERLTPYIIALPTQTSINVNTAPVAVLMSLADGISASDARSLDRDRADRPFESVTDFLKHDALAGRQIAEEGLTTSSEYFEVHLAVQLEGARIRLVSLLSRVGREVTTVHRLRRRWLDG